MAKSPGAGSASVPYFRDAMRDLIGTKWAAVWEAIPAVLESDDPTAVHRVRVASRQLRAAMDLAKPCFPRDWYRPLHTTAKAITRSLGAVRDRDVILDVLARERDQAEDDAQPGIEHLMSVLRDEREQRRKEMRKFLRKLESRGTARETRRRFGGPTTGKRSKNRKRAGKPARTLQRTQLHAGPNMADPPLEPLTASTAIDPYASVAANARRVLAIRIEQLFRYRSIIPNPDESELLHDARIAAKRLRYTLELFPDVFGEEGDQLLKQLRGLQDALGNVHDRDVLIERIEHELAASSKCEERPELGSSLGVLLGEEQRKRAQIHACAVDSWREMEREHIQERLVALTHTQAVSLDTD